MHLCVDYCYLNRVTIPNQDPLLRIDDLLEHTRGSNWFTKLDLKNGYNRIRIAEGDEWKTTFHAEKGLFKYTVMLFGLTNAPANFQEMMDEILKDVEGVLWYLDNILNYGGLIEAEHQQVVERVLQKLLEYGLTINLEKSVFYVHGVDFL